MIILRAYSDLRTRQLVRRVQFGSGAKLTLFGELGFDSRAMFQLARYGIFLIRDRVSKVIGSNDTPMKPLTKRYAIRKTKAGKGNRRNLTLSGDMLRNISVRSISATQARIDITSRKERVKARANEQRSAWWGWSGQDIVKLTVAASSLWKDKIVNIGFGSGRGRAFGSSAYWMNPNGRPTSGIGRLAA